MAKTFSNRAEMLPPLPVALPSASGSAAVSAHRWMEGRCSPARDIPLNPNQRTSIAAMVSYVSGRLGLSEMTVERRFSDHFNIPNPHCLPSTLFDQAIRFLADMKS
ncbi:MAG: hypothetical protein PHS57_07120 [Alphaproteobacteria bacterium]|nr:hypothetical protein [Alphaproteobacteria bacterium]